MKKIIGILTTFISVVGLIATCKQPAKEIASTAREFVALAEDVKRLIQSFTSENDKFASDVEEVIQTAQEGLKEFKTQQIASFWEKYWTEIEEKQHKLEVSLAGVEAKSNLYFQELNNNNAQIKDNKLKEADRIKNQNSYQKWILEYKKAQNAVLNAKMMVEKGKDYKWILRNDATRDVILNITTNELPQLSLQANKIKSDIKLFETNVTKILNQ